MRTRHFPFQAVLAHIAQQFNQSRLQFACVINGEITGELLIGYLVVFSQIIQPARALSDAFFKLRKGVAWHDGSAFTADDVVFSILRSQADTSNMKVYGNAIGKPRKIDDFTVELVTPVPNPVLLDMLSGQVGL